MNALASFIKAETLVKMVRDSTDFTQGIRSAGKGGYLLKEATDIVVVSPSIIQPDAHRSNKVFLA